MICTKSRCRIACATATLLASAIGSTAWANISLKPVGHPLGTNGWSQQFSMISATPFDNVGIVLSPVSGDDGTAGFATPALGFQGADASSSSYVQSPTSAAMITVASKVPVDGLQWESHFTGARTGQAFVLTLFAYDDSMSSSSVQTASARWDGTWWSLNTAPGITWEQYEQSVRNAASPIVPVPSALLLGILGLAFVAGLGRFRR